MKVKTSELQGAALDWAVNQIEECCDDPHTPFFSTNWAQGGPIIEQEKIGIVPDTNDANIWIGSVYEPEWRFNRTGPTPLVAAMRCYISSKLGDEIEVPDELMEGEVK